jgi:hypothetical protein
MQAIVSDMRKILAKHPHVEQQRLHRRVFFDNIEAENQALLVSCAWIWVAKQGKICFGICKALGTHSWACFESADLGFMFCEDTAL